MNLLRKLIREAIESVVLNEAAVPMSEILKNPNIGLVTTKKGNSFQLVLYDFRAHRVLATTDCVHVSDNIFQQTGVAAEKGYGPIIYELAMMTIYNNGLTLTRSGDIRGTAFEVWKKFFHRSDVGKFTIPETSKSYSEEYPEGDYEGDAIIGNTAFTMAPSMEYENLVERTPILIRMYKISENDIEQQGGNFFSYKYADS
jgi:hypothetical protein